ncbi:MAG: iron-sulfur cluster assembly scaffold protein [Verrucomicrobiales bacterium]
MIDNDFQKKVADAIANPKNMGEMEAADAIGTVGSANCGDMVRMWIKFKEERGKKVIDKASFQTFGCETAIAVASLATELIKGKTAEEALAMSGTDLAAGLGPLPPMKIHCGQLVEGALRSALAPEAGMSSVSPQEPPKQAPTLLDSLSGQTSEASKSKKLVFLDPPSHG